MLRRRFARSEFKQARPDQHSARVASVFLCDRHLQAIKVFGEQNLAGQSGPIITRRRRVEQTFLVSRYWRQSRQIVARDMDMAGRARTAPTAQRNDLIEPGISQRFHQSVAGLALDGTRGAVSIRYIDLQMLSSNTNALAAAEAQE
jgi:hypothetical protein